ncbi:MAG: hypothetical protein RBR97_19660 [Bacteroidales bacterium]|jgi:hypothetical protein|nr:hypothetical protein [Bacteroidales bacterium]
MKILTKLIIVIILNTLVFETYAQAVKILNQENAPISITSFTAKYQAGTSRYVSEGIRFDVEFSNKTNQEIVAYAFGFYAFDVFNRSLGRPLEGYSVSTIKTGSSSSGAWVQRLSSPSLFEKYGTGIAYVARVRLADGTIWNYNPANILKQLQEFEESLTLDDLKSE